MAERPLCGAQTKSNKPCKKPVNCEGDHCTWHMTEGPPKATAWMKRAVDSFYPIEEVVDSIQVKERFGDDYVEPEVPIDRDKYGTSVLMCMADNGTRVEIDFSRYGTVPLRPRLIRAGPLSSGLPPGCFLPVFHPTEWFPGFASSLTQTALAIHVWLVTPRRSAQACHQNHPLPMAVAVEVPADQEPPMVDQGNSQTPPCFRAYS
jgi:hypothetical protein